MCVISWYLPSCTKPRLGYPEGPQTNLLGLIGGVHVHHVLARDPAVFTVDDCVDDPVPNSLRTYELRALNAFQLHLLPDRPRWMRIIKIKVF